MSASRMARSMVPSPPRLTTRSARWPSSVAVTASAWQFSLRISFSMPSTWILSALGPVQDGIHRLDGVTFRVQDHPDDVHVSRSPLVIAIRSARA